MPQERHEIISAPVSAYLHITPEVIMTKLLIKLFIKDCEKTDDPAVRSRYGVLSGVVGIICNILLTAAKLIVD